MRANVFLFIALTTLCLNTSAQKTASADISNDSKLTVSRFIYAGQIRNDIGIELMLLTHFPCRRPDNQFRLNTDGFWYMG